MLFFCGIKTNRIAVWCVIALCFRLLASGSWGRSPVGQAIRLYCTGISHMAGIRYYH